MKTFSKSILMMLVLAVVPLAASAETVVRTGESVSVSSGQVVEQDFYTYGGTVTQSGEIVGDMHAISGSVTVNGPIGEDLTVLGGSVQVHSTIGDDLRVVGGETVLAGEVEGDVFVIGGLLKILSSATVDGNVYFYGGELDTEGNISGSLLGYSEKFMVNGSVDGGIDVTGELELGDRAEVQGGITYRSSKELNRAQNATVEGEISHVTGVISDEEGYDWWVVPSIIWAFTTLGCYLFLRNSIEGLVKGMRSNLTGSSLIGLGILVLLPVLAFILMATVLGVWFGVLALLSWLFLFISAWLLLPIFTGYYLFRFFKRERPVDILTVVSGIIATTVLLMIPALGMLLLFVGAVMIAGYLVLSLYQTIKEVI